MEYPKRVEQNRERCQVMPFSEAKTHHFVKDADFFLTAKNVEHLGMAVISPQENQDKTGNPSNPTLPTPDVFF